MAKKREFVLLANNCRTLEDEEEIYPKKLKKITQYEGGLPQNPTLEDMEEYLEYQQKNTAD